MREKEREKVKQRTKRKIVIGTEEEEEEREIESEREREKGKSECLFYLFFRGSASKSQTIAPFRINSIKVSSKDFLQKHFFASNILIKAFLCPFPVKVSHRGS